MMSLAHASSYTCYLLSYTTIMLIPALHKLLLNLFFAVTAKRPTCSSKDCSTMRCASAWPASPACASAATTGASSGKPSASWNAGSFVSTYAPPLRPAAARLLMSSRTAASVGTLSAGIHISKLHTLLLYTTCRPMMQASVYT